MAEKVVHRGGCHCKNVRWQVKAPAKVLCWDCNCSICSMKQNRHFIVPAADFELDEGSQKWLSLYTFGSHQAKHLFCKVCGICSFYKPRSNPDGIAITVRCIDPGTVKSIQVTNFDGQNWESSWIRFQKNRNGNHPSLGPSSISSVSKSIMKDEIYGSQRN